MLLRGTRAAKWGCMQFETVTDLLETVLGGADTGATAAPVVAPADAPLARPEAAKMLSACGISAYNAGVAAAQAAKVPTGPLSLRGAALDACNDGVAGMKPLANSALATTSCR